MLGCLCGAPGQQEGAESTFLREMEGERYSLLSSLVIHLVREAFSDTFLWK